MAGTLTISTLSDGTNSTSSTNCIQGSAKAWVNFNGSGGASVRASYNVSSVTRASTGHYGINFTNAMTDTNYAVIGSAGVGGYNGFSLVTANDDSSRGTNTTTATTIAIYVPSGGTGAGTYDATYVQVAIFR